ncbi:hypothetical protein SK128_028417 [Halocaridina rubra]|uniref:WWE domain-containing protein n=1 Tax=Halocaridina rubra TaxID=373956 RepID=A0AAN8X1V1_HALRR
MIRKKRSKTSFFIILILASVLVSRGYYKDFSSSESDGPEPIQEPFSIPSSRRPVNRIKCSSGDKDDHLKGSFKDMGRKDSFFHRPRACQQKFRGDHVPTMQRGAQSMDGNLYYFHQERQRIDDVSSDNCDEFYCDIKQNSSSRQSGQHHRPLPVSPRSRKARFSHGIRQKGDELADVSSDNSNNTYQERRRDFSPRGCPQHRRPSHTERERSMSPHQRQTTFGQNSGHRGDGLDEEFQKYRPMTKVSKYVSKRMEYTQPSDSNVKPVDEAFGVPTPEILVGILTRYPRYEATLLSLLDNHNIMPKDIRNLISVNRNTFYLRRDMVKLSPRVMLCSDHIGKGCFSKSSCDSLHICPNYLNRVCLDKSCQFGHKWKTNHNISLLKKLYIDNLGENDIHSLIAAVTANKTPNYPLDVCMNYNNQRCSFLNCKRIHLCFGFVTNGARCQKPKCQLNHNVKAKQCQILLKNHGIALDETPRDIVSAIVAANSKLKSYYPFTDSNKPQQGKNQKQKVRKGSDSSTSSQSNQSNIKNPIQRHTISTVWSHYLEGDVVIPEICYKSVEGRCQYEKSGCMRLHAKENFHWQVCSPSSGWFNLQKHQVKCLEESYCDPSQDGVHMPQLENISKLTHDLLVLLGQSRWFADYQRMKILDPLSNGCLQIRRLCTETIHRIILKECTFLWYFKNDHKKWIEYGKADSSTSGRMIINLSSQEIENHYRQNSVKQLPFRTPHSHYILDLDKMVQINQNTAVTHNVRRRPQPHLHQSIIQPIRQSKCHWTYHLIANVKVAEICSDSVNGVCENENIGCPRLHSKLHYHWQILGQDKNWYNLQPSQITSLEMVFCDPSKNSVNLTQTHTAILEKHTEGLAAVLGNSIWQADFDTMKLTNNNNNVTLMMRRLCSQSTSAKNPKESSYSWYFLDINDKWIEYGQYDTTRNAKMKSNVFSSEIEARYFQNSFGQMNFTTGSYNYILNFSTMEQVNQSTNQRRKVRRRPQPHLKDESLGNLVNDLPSSWDPMTGSEKMKIVHLFPSSAEYKIIEDLIMGQLPQAQVQEIKKIQNPKLWINFQNSVNKVPSPNVRQMFRATKYDVIPSICYDNYQQIFPLGINPTVGSNFSNTAAEACRHCQSCSKGFKYLFIMRVLLSGDNFNHHYPEYLIIIK